MNSEDASIACWDWPTSPRPNVNETAIQSRVKLMTSYARNTTLYWCLWFCTCPKSLTEGSDHCDRRICCILFYTIEDSGECTSLACYVASGHIICSVQLWLSYVEPFLLSKTNRGQLLMLWRCWNECISWVLCFGNAFISNEEPWFLLCHSQAPCLRLES